MWLDLGKLNIVKIEFDTSSSYKRPNQLPSLRQIARFALEIVSFVRNHATTTENELVAGLGVPWLVIA